MRYIVLVLACVASCLPLLAGKRRSGGDDLEPGSKITETITGNFNQKLVIDHNKYDGPGETPTARSDDEMNFVYPEDVQLVPKVPISPESPKYALVPVKRLTTASTKTAEATSDYDIGFTPTIPSDFEQEIAKIRIPHTGLPSFLSDPPPQRYEEHEDGNEDEAEDEERDNEEDEPSNDHFFTDEFLEPPEFRDTVTTTKSSPVSFSQFRSKNIKPTRSSQPKTVAVTKTITFYGKTNDRDFDDIPARETDDDDFRQIQARLKHKRVPGSVTPCCSRNTRLQHYSPSQPMARARPLHAYPVYWGPPKMTGNRGTRVYVRYPRNYRPYHQPGPAYGRVKVMTQNFVQHPRNRYRPRSPVMMSSTQFRAKKPSSGKKKKKKKSKGECKPKRIIQEIHYHHYDPQLSAQLAPLEGINLKEGDDYEHQVKVITKETEVEDGVNKGHADYEDHNLDLEKEMDKHKAETEHRLSHPEYYGDSYNPHYPESGSTEYIDYNVQTDSSSAIRDPHPAHEYPEDRAFRNRGANSTQPLQGGRYVKHRVVKYYYQTPDTRRR